MTRVMTLGLALAGSSILLAGCDNKFPAVTYKFSPDQKQAFEKEYPFVVNSVLDNSRLQVLNLTYGKIKGNNGWKVLSNAIYGTDQFAELLQELNGNAPTPISATNGVRNAFCGMSDSYCAPVVKLRARSMAYLSVPAPQKPAADDTSKPSGTVQPKIPSAGASGSSSAGKKNDKISIASMSPMRARTGIEVPIIIKLKGEIETQGSPDVSISAGSGISPVDIAWKGANTIGFTANLYYAKPGKYAVSVTIDGSPVGSSSFEVLPEKTDQPEKPDQ